MGRPLRTSGGAGRVAWWRSDRPAPSVPTAVAAAPDASREEIEASIRPISVARSDWICEEIAAAVGSLRAPTAVVAAVACVAAIVGITTGSIWTLDVDDSAATERTSAFVSACASGIQYRPFPISVGFVVPVAASVPPSLETTAVMLEASPVTGAPVVTLYARR
jgi:hypothetical protein